MNNWAKIFISDSRSMAEVADGAVDLVVTSPPYWQIKDYGVTGQIGYGQSLHEYLRDLYRTWGECFRVLRDGGRLCLNIGDQFARTAVYGRYQVIPLHAEFISQCQKIGFDFLGAIIWQKKTTMNPTGGAVVMGSYPYPPNGLVEIDYEFIEIFKKPGAGKKVSAEIKQASKLTKEEWKEYFGGHWQFGGARKVGHEAMFPEELPRRLIRMFAFRGDTVLDPFLGSGTTVKVALEQGCNALGYEINPGFLEIVRQKIGIEDNLFNDIQIIKANRTPAPPAELGYTPGIQDARPLPQATASIGEPDGLSKVTGVIDADTIQLSTGQSVRFLGVACADAGRTKDYLQQSLVGKKVFLKNVCALAGGQVAAYVYLKNRIFVNAYLIKSGLGIPEPEVDHRLKAKFTKLYQEGEAGPAGKSPNT
jgi:modification methylase